MTHLTFTRAGSRTAATSKMERFVIIVNGFKPLMASIIKRSILDVAAVLDTPLFTDFIVTNDVDSLDSKFNLHTKK